MSKKWILRAMAASGTVVIGLGLLMLASCNEPSGDSGSGGHSDNNTSISGVGSATGGGNEIAARQRIGFLIHSVFSIV